MLMNNKNDDICIRELKEQLNRLTWDYLQCLTEKRNEDNVVFSPLSIYTLLAMAADTTAGRTKKEIFAELYKRTDPEREFSCLSDLLQHLESGHEFSIANVVVVKESIKNSIKHK